MKDDVLIKIQVSDEDRETLSKMLDYAITASDQCACEFEELKDHYLEIKEKFMNLRQRIVFEEKEKSE